MKTKSLNSGDHPAELPFVLAYAESRFSEDAAQMISNNQELSQSEKFLL